MIDLVATTMKLKFGRTRAVSGTENMSPAGFLAFSLILVVFAVDLRPAEAGFFGFLNNKARALRESPNAVPRVGWLVGSSSGDPYSQECWKSAAEMAVAGSGIELAFVGGAPAAFAPTSPPSTAKTTVGADDESETWRKFNVLYKSGVRTFIGLDDHDAGKLLKRLAPASPSDNPSPSSRVEYEDVTFVSPFATSDTVRNHPSVVALSPSSYQTAGSVLSKTGEWSYSEILPVLGGPGKKPAGDDLRELRGVLGFRLLEPVIAAESGNLQHDIEEIKTQLFLRFWENPNANIYFDSKPHFVSFLRSLNSTYGESLASRILFSPNAVFFDDDLSSSSTERAAYVTATHMQLHSAAFLGGEDYTSPVRRRLFSTLNDDGRRLGRPCSVAAALVYDAALVAKAAVRMKTSPPSVRVVEESIQGATGTMTLKMSVAGQRDTAKQDVGNGPSGERSSFAVRASLVRPGETDIFARFFAADPARYVGSGVRIAQHSPWILDGMLETNRRPAGVRPSEVNGPTTAASRTSVNSRN